MRLLDREAIVFTTMQSTPSSYAAHSSKPRRFTATFPSSSLYYQPGGLQHSNQGHERSPALTMRFLLCFKSRRASEDHATAEIVQTQTSQRIGTKPKPARKRKPQLPRFPVPQSHQNLINALSRLRTFFALPKTQLTFLAFSPIITDLDTVLFSNLLSPHTIVEWARMTRRIREITLPYDISRSGISMVHIRLNKTMFKLDAKEEIWGTVLHEMLQAYLDLTTGWVSLRVPHHGELFERSCAAMVGRLGLRGLEARHVV
jgi:hypothetical protein